MTSVECPLCGANVELESDVIEGELLTCSECGSELEVASLDPPALKEAPQTEEDWGE